MPTITIQEGQAQLVDLVRRLAPGDEVVITENSDRVSDTGPYRTENAMALQGRQRQGENPHRPGLR